MVFGCALKSSGSFISARRFQGCMNKSLYKSVHYSSAKEDMLIQDVCAAHTTYAPASFHAALQQAERSS